MLSDKKIDIVGRDALLQPAEQLGRNTGTGCLCIDP